MKDRYWLFGLVFALFMAGFVSLYASSDPDGLERVAEDHGFLEKGEGHNVIDSPMPDYVIPKMENETLSSSLAGVAGTVIIFVLVLGIGFVLRKHKK